MGKKSKKRRKKAEEDFQKSIPILERAGTVNFLFAGDRTDQTKEGLKKRRQTELEKNDCYINSDSDSDIEISEGLHKDFEKSKKQMPNGYKMMQKMGYVPGKGLGKNSTGNLNPVIPDSQSYKKTSF